MRFTKGKKVKCFEDATFTRLGAKEELHLLVRLLMSRALNTIIHQIMHQKRPRSCMVSFMRKALVIF